MLPYNIMQSAHSQNNKNANGNGSGRSSSSHPMDPASSSTCMSTSTNVQHQHDTGTAHSAISHYTSNFTTMFPLLPSNNQWPSHHNNHHFFPNFPPCPPHPSQFQASLYQNHQQQQLIPQHKVQHSQLEKVGLTGTLDTTTNTTTTTSSIEEAESSDSADPSPVPFKVNDVFPSYDHFSQVVGDYCVSVRMDPKWKTTNNKREKSDDYVSYRVTCPRSGKHKSKKKPGQSNSRPTRER